MDVFDFNLNQIFQHNAKEYATRPVKAMKYQPGIENAWMVYFESESLNGKKSRYFGVKFFPTKDKAQTFIDADDKQYVIENGVSVGMKVKCDDPLPVLCREKSDMESNKGVLFRFGDKAFISDESEKYEFYILDCEWMSNDIWLIQDANGNLRVWDNSSEETFFGFESDIVYEVSGDEYIKIAV